MYHHLSINETIKNLKTTKNGLTTQEASKRLKEYGLNKLPSPPKPSKFFQFLAEFKNLMIIILIISALVSFIISFINHESFIDSIIILAIVFINALLGFMQELKADKSLEALNKMQITNTKVKRDNQISLIKSENLVPGDLIILEAGDIIPADARLIACFSLQVDESSLTGESLAIEKNLKTLQENTPLSNRQNMIYSGTQVTYGKCQAIVCATNTKTEFGQIAQSLAKEEKEITPLQKQISEISKFLTYTIAFIIIIMFLIGLIKDIPFLEILMLSLSLAIAAIPEGLPAVITITLSLGVNSLAQKKAIVRHMSSIETLGCTQIICTDKTGTITQNKMQVVQIYTNNQFFNPNLITNDELILKIMALNNDVEKNENTYVGEATEIAFYNCCENKLDISSLRQNYPRLNEIPFDSQRKMMSTIHINNNHFYLYTKGSFDSLIKVCTHIYLNNKVYKLTNKLKQDLTNTIKEEASKAYRLLAFAYKELNKPFDISPNLENNLIFVGFVTLIDPPRPDVKESIKLCQKAHIRPIMITGDSLDTAKAIAKDIGILDNRHQAISGQELDTMSEEQLTKNISNYSVYARVSPIHKLAIIKAWQNHNKVVAMSGDGINDAPALKKADIGVGMGITGTQVSKNVSDIVLADDSFSTIVTAIKEGRKIYDNIRKVLVYLLVGNIAEVLVVFIGMLFGLKIFSPLQLLYINLITDSIPAIALAFEKPQKDIMNRPIRSKNKSIFTPFIIAKISLTAILKTIVILLVFFINLKLYNLEIANTCTFLSLAISEIIYAYSCRNLKENVLKKGLLSNKKLNQSTLIIIIIQIIIFTTPLKNIFQIENLNYIQVFYSLFIVLAMFTIDELSKKLLIKKFKD